MASERTTIAMALALAAVFAYAAIAPVYNYDFFWHLATGRLILDHHALPLHDPFALASDPKPWINGEWLFEVVLFFLGGFEKASLLRAVFIGLAFAAAFFFSARGTDPGNAAFLTALAFAAGRARFDVRPSTIGAG